MGVLGSCVATFAVVLPSFILMLTISKFFLKYQKHPAVEAVFSGLRPAVVGLLASAALVLMNTENFSSPRKICTLSSSVSSSSLQLSSEQENIRSIPY